MQQEARTKNDQRILIRMLTVKEARQFELLSDILKEINHDHAHGGPSRLSEALVGRIEEIVYEK